MVLIRTKSPIASKQLRIPSTVILSFTAISSSNKAIQYAISASLPMIMMITMMMMMMMITMIMMMMMMILPEKSPNGFVDVLGILIRAMVHDLARLHVLVVELHALVVATTVT